MINVDVGYRPVRVGWCVPEGNPAAVRTALRLTHALWGGAYNPVVCIGKGSGSQQAAERLVREFRVDVLWPIDPDPTVQKFIGEHPHLCWKDLDFSNGAGVLGSARRTARLLGVGTAYLYWSRVLGGLRQRSTELDQARANQPVQGLPLRLTWADWDPLADYFLATFGDLPDGVHPTGVSRWEEHHLTRFDAITSRYGPIDLPQVPMSLHRLTRVHLEEPDEPESAPGLMCGDTSSMDDIVTYWNLRASGEDLLFFDPRHLDRMSWMVERSLCQLGKLHTPRVGIRWGEHPFPAGVERQLDEQQIRIEDRTASTAHAHARMFQGHRGTLATVDDHRAPCLAVNLPDPLNLPGWEEWRRRMPDFQESRGKGDHRDEAGDQRQAGTGRQNLQSLPASR